MKQAASLLALVIVMQLGAGCATIVTGGGEEQAVRFASTPRGATVYVDDNPVGQTPISVRLTRKDEHKVRIEHAGYRPFERTIGSGFNEWIIGNVLIGGLIGLSVDLLSGANSALDTNNVHARMVKDDSAAYAAVAAQPPPRAAYTTTGPPAAPANARPAAYLNTAPAAAPPAPPAPLASPTPVYQPPPAYQAPAPTQVAPAPAQPAPTPAPARQPPKQPASPATPRPYQGW
jgi:hypothetical protein